MDTDTIEKQTADMFAAIEGCIAGEFTLPALILIYSAIDIMAWLNRNDADDATRSDFISWVEAFLLPDSGLSCTGIDLYGARCSVLHSYTAESKLSRDGKAHEIFYAWGTFQEQDLQKIIDRVNTQDARAVHVEKLFAALKVGAARFIARAGHLETVKTRAKKRFVNMLPLKLES